MESTQSAYIRQVVEKLAVLWPVEAVAGRVQGMMEVVVALALLDLEPAREDLTACYSGARSGARPRSMVGMLRSVVLMGMMGVTSFNRWARILKERPELFVLCGFDDGKPEPPGVGTFYDFCARLVDGPYQRRCPHVQRASERYRGSRGRFRRHLAREKAELKAAEAAGVEWHEGKARRMVDQALATLEQPLPDDVQRRLDLLLMRCAVVPSAHLGLLGNLTRLDLAADASLLPTQAHRWGRATCSCRRDGQAHTCNCDRRYADPDATWGYDATHDSYVFGYKLHALVTTNRGLDLPLQVMVHGAHNADVILGTEALSRFYKLLQRELSDARINAVTADCAYDATAFYDLIIKLGRAPLIPLHPNSRTVADRQGTPRDEQGRPLCPANLPMRDHGYNKRTGKLVYNCPVKRPGREAGRQVMRVHTDQCPRGSLCEPKSKMGPLVYLSVTDDPRLNPPIPRGTQPWQEAYNKRTCVERFFAMTTEHGHLAHRPYRRQYLYHISATAQAIAIHAKAWVRRTLDAPLPRSFDELRVLMLCLCPQPPPTPAT